MILGKNRTHSLNIDTTTHISEYGLGHTIIKLGVNQILEYVTMI